MYVPSLKRKDFFLPMWELVPVPSSQKVFFWNQCGESWGWQCSDETLGQACSSATIQWKHPMLMFLVLWWDLRLIWWWWDHKLTWRWWDMCVTVYAYMLPVQATHLASVYRHTTSWCLYVLLLPNAFHPSGGLFLRGLFGSAMVWRYLNLHLLGGWSHCSNWKSEPTFFPAPGSKLIV